MLIYEGYYIECIDDVSYKTFSDIINGQRLKRSTIPHTFEDDDIEKENRPLGCLIGHTYLVPCRIQQKKTPSFRESILGYVHRSRKNIYSSVWNQQEKYASFP